MRAARHTLAAPLLTGAAVAAATAVLAVHDPHRAGSYGFCPLLVLTGFACPACGGLRATHDLVHLDLAGAWSANALWVLLVPVLVALWTVWTIRAARGLPAPRFPVSVGVAGLVVLVLFGVARNLPPLVPHLTPWLA
ncbi:DUF2752 domain-containing protein [Antribacter gilvus]|uniref:DUF2752 domain-containing protein n=1 Tax=Antribacter gilvus TaxID=2304675 RepID=UPI000F78F7C8|nr:DUF2752 domain-containing protein [Antribacter gilvus]